MSKWYGYNPEEKLLPTVSIELPPSTLAWANLKDLKPGEIVSMVHPDKASSSDLRLVTEEGAFALYGIKAACAGDDTYYYRLPAGTRVTLTVEE